VNQNAEFLLKRDEACTLCLADMLQPTNITVYNKSPSEILNDGLYFSNPLLKEALKTRVEQQFLFQPDECLGMNQQTLDPEIVSKGASQIQAEELLKNLVEKIEKLPSTKANIKEGLEKHRESLNPIIKEKIEFAKILFQKANSNTPNKRTRPQDDVQRRLEKILSEFQDTIVPEQLESKLAGFSEQYLENLQDLNQNIQNLKNKMTQTQNIQDFQETIQEISLLYNQAVVELEQQSKIQHQLDQDSILDNLDQRLKGMIDPLQDYLKPIKTTLKTGERLAVRDRISSDNGIFSLGLLRDQWTEYRVVLYKFENIPIWSSVKVSAPTHSEAELFFDPRDGVLKILHTGAVTLKTLNPKNPNYRGNEAYLMITNSGEIKIIESESGLKLWTPLYSLPASKVVFGVFSLWDILVSENEIYTLTVERDCNLILYEHSTPIWRRAQTESNRGSNSCRLSLQRDGSLTSDSYSYRAIITPDRRSQKGKPSLIIKNDGTLTIRDEEQELWKSK